MKAYYRPYKAEDYEQVLKMKLRNNDILELEVMSGRTWQEALKFSVLLSKCTWVIIYKNKIEGIFGIGEWDDNKGTPWFVATNKFDNFSYAVAKQSKQVLEMMFQIYPYLWNYIYANHFVAKRWLQWLGFTIEDNIRWIDNHPFQKFYMKKE